MLVESGLITEERLKQALIDQKKAGLKLGQFLTRLGIVSEQQIIEMLSKQLKIAKYHPDISVGHRLTRFISYEVAQKYQLRASEKEDSDHCDG